MAGSIQPSRRRFGKAPPKCVQHSHTVPSSPTTVSLHPVDHNSTERLTTRGFISIQYLTVLKRARTIFPSHKKTPTRSHDSLTLANWVCGDHRDEHGTTAAPLLPPPLPHMLNVSNNTLQSAVSVLLPQHKPRRQRRKGGSGSGSRPGQKTEQQQQQQQHSNNNNNNNNISKNVTVTDKYRYLTRVRAL